MPPNIFSAVFEYEDVPDGYDAGEAAIGKQANGRSLVVRLYELPPGQSLCPYHYEYEEEWLVVIAGAVVVRRPAGEEQLQRGDVLCFPPGPDGAHKVTNRGEGAARVLMFSRHCSPAVAVYPDSDKIGVRPGNKADELMLRRADGHRDYWDGEA